MTLTQIPKVKSFETRLFINGKVYGLCILKIIDLKVAKIMISL